MKGKKSTSTSSTTKAKKPTTAKASQSKARTEEAEVYSPEEADSMIGKAVAETDSLDQYAEAIEQVNEILVKEGIPTLEALGTMGAPIYDGYVASNEKNAALTGTAKYVTYQNILINTSIVGAGVRYFLNMLGNAKWPVTPAVVSEDKQEEAQMYADFVKEEMHGMKRSWSSVVRKGAMFRFHGFSLQEVVPYKRKDGRIGIKDIAPRPQSTIEKWLTDDAGYYTKVVQRDPITSGTHTLPMWRLVYLVDDTLTDSPEGLGIFRHLVKPAETLARYLELEGFGFEMDLRGVPVGKAPISMINQLLKTKQISKKQKAAILKPLRDFINDRIKNPSLGFIMDSAVYTDQGNDRTPSAASMWGVDLLSSQSTTQAEIANAIDRMTHDLARGLGVQQLLLGSGKVGTQALSKDNSKNFLLIVASSLKELSLAYRQQCWVRLWQWNGFPPEMMPTVEPEEIQLNEIEHITKALNDLAKSGAVLMPNDPVINAVRGLLGMPKQEKVDLEEYLKVVGKSGNTGMPGGEKTTPSEQSGKTESEKD